MIPINKYTKEDIVSRLLIVHNGDIELIGEYYGMKVATKFKHKIYGEWISTPDKVINCSHSHPNKPRKSTKIFNRVCISCRSNISSSKWHKGPTCHNCYCKEYNKTRLKINTRIAMRMRKRVWSALKGIHKTDNTINLLGCSIEELKIYLESKFITGMSWDNYGSKGWHIDHIRPLSSFDLSLSEQQKIAFNYINTQPLWAKDNLIKGDKYES